MCLESGDGFVSRGNEEVEVGRKKTLGEGGHLRRGWSWRTIDADAIAQVGICEDLGAVGNRQ